MKGFRSSDLTNNWGHIEQSERLSTYTPMTTVNSTVGSAPLSLAADSGGPQELLADIKKTKEKLEKLEQHIETIRTGNDAAVKALGYGSRDEAKAELKDLKDKEKQLRGLLLQYEARLTAQQQQQSGGGASRP